MSACVSMHVCVCVCGHFRMKYERFLLHISNSNTAAAAAAVDTRRSVVQCVYAAIDKFHVCACVCSLVCYIVVYSVCRHRQIYSLSHGGNIQNSCSSCNSNSFIKSIGALLPHSLSLSLSRSRLPAGLRIIYVQHRPKIKNLALIAANKSLGSCQLPESNCST